MLFKESLETLVETPLKVHKTLKEIEVKQYDVKEHVKEIEAQVDKFYEEKPTENTDEQIESSDLDKIIHSLLRTQSAEEEIHSKLSTLHAFLKDQIRVIESDVERFEEIVAKSTLLIKNEKITQNELNKKGEF